MKKKKIVIGTFWETEEQARKDAEEKSKRFNEEYQFVFRPVEPKGFLVLNKKQLIWL